MIYKGGGCVSIIMLKTAIDMRTHFWVAVIDALLLLVIFCKACLLYSLTISMPWCEDSLQGKELPISKELNHSYGDWGYFVGGLFYASSVLPTWNCTICCVLFID